MACVYIGVGSNMGHREKNIRDAFRCLKKNFPSIISASIYETKPMYNVNQPDFLNTVFKFETTMEPFELLKLLQGLEDKTGRNRKLSGYKGPRPLDLDILLYGDLILKEQTLTLPHPGIKERNFVLMPLTELDSELRDPETDIKYSDLLHLPTDTNLNSLIYLNKEYLMVEEKEENDISALRLQVYMARCGVGSRRFCDECISHGLVMVNGKLVKEMGVKVLPGDVVEYKGRRLYPDRKKVYIAFNKPVKVLCTNDDPEGRTLAVDFFKEYPYRLHNVGRLDYMSSGLIFYTNDGDFTKAVAHPSAKIEKEYIVETSKPIPEELMIQFCKGFVIEGIKYRIKEFSFKTSTKVHIVLVEGKNREIRRFFQFHSLKIKKLQRIRIGSVRLDSKMPVGCYRELTEKEIASFFKVRENDSEKAKRTF